MSILSSDARLSIMLLEVIFGTSKAWFTIKPKEFWYRVVRLNIDKDFRGDSFIIKHDLIVITEERMKEFEFKP